MPDEPQFEFKQEREPKKLTGVPGFFQRWAGAMQRAGSIEAARRHPAGDLLRQLKAQELEHNRWVMHEKAYNMELATWQRQGMAEVQSILANGSFDDPETINAFLAKSAQYGLPTEFTEPILRRFNNAKLYQDKIAENNAYFKNRMELERLEHENRMRQIQAGGAESSAYWTQMMERNVLRDRVEQARNSGNAEALAKAEDDLWYYENRTLTDKKIGDLTDKIVDAELDGLSQRLKDGDITPEEHSAEAKRIVFEGMARSRRGRGSEAAATPEPNTEAGTKADFDLWLEKNK